MKVEQLYGIQSRFIDAVDENPTEAKTSSDARSGLF